MSNPSKAKGTAFETAVVNWLTAGGHRARRKVLAGANDEGDIDVDLWTLEAKNCRTLALSQWVKEADAESRNCGRPVAVVVKRRGISDPGESYVVMPLRVFALSVLSGLSSRIDT